MANPDNDPKINQDISVRYLVELFAGRSNDEINIAVSKAKDIIAESKRNRNKPLSWREIIADC